MFVSRVTEADGCCCRGTLETDTVATSLVPFIRLLRGPDKVEKEQKQTKGFYSFFRADTFIHIIIAHRACNE